MSVSKVRSRDSETTLRALETAPVVFEARAALQLAAEVRAEALDEHAARRRRGELRRACVSPSAASRAAVFGPIPGTSPGGAAAKRAHACSRVSTTKPGGLLRVGGDLRDELVGADADRAGQPDLGG